MILNHGYNIYINIIFFLHDHHSLKKKTLEPEKTQEKTTFKSPKTPFNPSSKHQNYLPLISTSISTIFLLQTADQTCVSRQTATTTGHLHIIKVR